MGYISQSGTGQRLRVFQVQVAGGERLREWPRVRGTWWLSNRQMEIAVWFHSQTHWRPTSVPHLCSLLCILSPPASPRAERTIRHRGAAKPHLLHCLITPPSHSPLILSPFNGFVNPLQPHPRYFALKAPDVLSPTFDYSKFFNYCSGKSISPHVSRGVSASIGLTAPRCSRQIYRRAGVYPISFINGFRKYGALELFCFPLSFLTQPYRTHPLHDT